jgi:hypothetical protein
MLCKPQSGPTARFRNGIVTSSLPSCVRERRLKSSRRSPRAGEAIGLPVGSLCESQVVTFRRDDLERIAAGLPLRRRRSQGFSAKAFGPRFCPLIDHSIFQFPDFDRGEDQPSRPFLSTRKCNPFLLIFRSFLPKNCAAAGALFTYRPSLGIIF